MDRKHLIFLSLITGILLTPAWYPWGNGLLLIIAFIPLLFVENAVSALPKPGKKIFNYSFLGFLVWNLLATWWIKNASLPGMFVAVLLNSLLMSGCFWLFSLTRRKLGDRYGYPSLIFYWLAYEYLYLNGEISWTWLNLGNGFANDIKLIQWYEYTGTLGGTLWVLVLNILIYKLIKVFLNNKSLTVIKPRIIIFTSVLIIPIAFSLVRYITYKENEDPYEIVVIQPNIDPYEKFNEIPPQEQMNIFIRLADSLVTPTTDYIVVPETFINNNVWLDKLEENPSIKTLRAFHSLHPRTKIVVGATTYKIYKNPEDVTATAKPLDALFYDSFNTALQIDSSSLIPSYHKSQLVVGVEKMPYPDKLGFLKKLMLNLGGTFRSHGTQDYRDAFVSPSGDTRVAPVICYESIFGEYVTEYISEADANFIFIITNDGWWGDTPGYIQHNSFASLRAIETRRSLARSANTGISSFINQKGMMLQIIPWWEEGAIRETLNASDKYTFYVKHGDYLGRAATVLSLIMLLYMLTKFLTPAKIVRKN